MEQIEDVPIPEVAEEIVVPESVGIFVSLTIEETVDVSAKTLEECLARFETQALHVPRAAEENSERALPVFVNTCVPLLVEDIHRKASEVHQEDYVRDEHSPTGPGHKIKRRKKGRHSDDL